MHPRKHAPHPPFPNPPHHICMGLSQNPENNHPFIYLFFCKARTSQNQHNKKIKKKTRAKAGANHGSFANDLYTGDRERERERKRELAIAPTNPRFPHVVYSISARQILISHVYVLIFPPPQIFCMEREGGRERGGEVFHFSQRRLSYSKTPEIGLNLPS